jgi:hypothetical protein
MDSKRAIEVAPKIMEQQLIMDAYATDGRTADQPRAYRDLYAEVTIDLEQAKYPKVLTPITLLQMRKLFKEITRCSSLDSPHYLARRHRRRQTHQNMHMIFTRHASDDPNLKSFTGLPDPFPNSFRNLTLQNFIAILRHPYKVILDLKNRMATVSVFHHSPPCLSLPQLKLTG